MENYKKKDFFYIKLSEEIEEEIFDCITENPVDENMLHQQHQQQLINHENLEINDNYEQNIDEMDEMIFTYSNTIFSNNNNILHQNESNLIKLETINPISNNINNNIYNDNSNSSGCSSSNFKIKRRNSIIIDNVETNIRIDTTNITSSKKRRIII
ncbi:hypothetical protein ACTFIV_009805 [Dictyostelium citrinum]